MNTALLSRHSQILPLCLLAASAASPMAHAATISYLQADGSYQLGSAALVILPSDMATPPGTTNADVLSFPSDSSGNQAGIHAYGNSVSASFGSRASGEGSYDVTSKIAVTVQNVGDSISSTIIPGRVYVSIPAGYTAIAGEFVSAHLQFELCVDGCATAKYTSDASLLLDTISPFLHSSMFETPGGFNIGYVLNSGPNDWSWDFGPSIQTFTGLDTLSPSHVGDHTLIYTIFAEAHGWSHAVDCAGGGHPGGALADIFNGEPGGQGTCQPGSGAQSGDPLPEPGSLALFGIGMAVLLRSCRQQDRLAKTRRRG